MQYGQEVETEFMSHSLSLAMPSAWNRFPTVENPSLQYKYLSVEFNLDMDLMSWQRDTYSTLDWLGDMGGLFDALFTIFKAMLAPISTY